MASKTKTKKRFKIRQIFNEKGNGFDLPFLGIVIILLRFGLVMLYSASYVKAIYKFDDSLHYIRKQVLYAILGFGVMIFASRVDYHIYRRFIPALMALTYVLLLVVLTMKDYNGCHRWITIPGVGTFQPSEIAKFVEILVFSHLIERNYDRMKDPRYGIAPFMLVIVSFVSLLYFEPHLSCIVIICFIGATMMFVGGSDIKWFGVGFLALLGAFMIAFLLFRDQIGRYIYPRIESWRHPELDLQGDGYQSYQALLAIGSGGLFGLGIGNSRQKHLHLPEMQNDFIYPIICEELGFIGGMLVIILFLALLFRGFQIAKKAKDKFGAMMVIGIITQISIQAFLNIAVATNTIPNTGISLPFFSDGGTALLMVLGELGIVLSVSRQANMNEDDGE